MNDKPPNNPNGANQYVADPRQSLFLAYYLDPKSDTFSNALQSALRAGYEQEYAESLTSKMPSWLAESVGDHHLVKTAENNLKEFLEMDTTNMTVKNEQVVTYDDPQLKKIKADVTKFTLERLNKKKYAGKETLAGELKDGDKSISFSVTRGSD